MDLIPFIELLLSKMDVNHFDNIKEVRIRLYGGWYEEKMLSRLAQRLASEIEENKPYIYKIQNIEKKLIVNIELSYSLISDENKHLFYTYRPRGVFYGLKIKSHTDVSCTEECCPIKMIEGILNKNKCPICQRNEMQSLFYRGEQKLVDTMITSDIVFLSANKKIIVMVSSDDDFWPGIITAIANGSKVIHVETKSRPKDFDFSSYMTHDPNYILKTLN